MRSLGGIFERKSGSKGSRRRSSMEGASRQPGNPALRLKTSQQWSGRTQRFGPPVSFDLMPAGAGLATGRLAAGLFVGASIIYGFAIGGYAELGLNFAQEQTHKAVALAGFTVQDLDIVGQERSGDQEILTALGIGPGASMFAIDADAAQRRLEHVPWIKRARVLRLLPSTLHVEIVERQPFAIWQENGKLHLVDVEGRKIAPLGQRAREDFLLVVGKGAGASAKELTDQLKDFVGLRDRLQAAIRVADRRWTLKLQNGLEVKLPEHGVVSALRRLDQLEREGRVLSADISALDLRLPDRITLRLTEQAAARRKDPKGKKAVQDT